MRPAQLSRAGRALKSSAGTRTLKTRTAAPAAATVVQLQGSASPSSLRLSLSQAFEAQSVSAMGPPEGFRHSSTEATDPLAGMLKEHLSAVFASPSWGAQQSASSAGAATAARNSAREQAQQLASRLCSKAPKLAERRM